MKRNFHGHRILVALAVLAGGVASPGSGQTAMAPKMFNVRDFGALGDGTNKDTVAFQKALDTCAVSGGGEVVVPAGNYLIGSVQLGFGTVLRLETNCVI